MPSDQHILHRWVNYLRSCMGRHELLMLTEADTDQDVISELTNLAREHYVDRSDLADQLEQHGAKKTANIIRESLPTCKRAKSGDLGEILAAEVVELYLGYRVPVRRLRYRTGQNIALFGDDIVAVSHDEHGKLRLLKGESKSRRELSTQAISDAHEQLKGNKGRPTNISVIFLVKRLREAGEKELATELERAMLNRYRGYDVRHMLFVLTGTDPIRLLTEYIKKRINKCSTLYAIGLFVKKHENLIEQIFRGIPNA